MILFWTIVIILMTRQTMSLSCEDEKELHERECETEKHGNYTKCVKWRLKRNSSNCHEQDCNYCGCERCKYSVCENQCNNCCESCCPNFVRCRTSHCCHRQCHYECQSFACRSDCRRSCYNGLGRAETASDMKSASLIEAESRRTNAVQNSTNLAKHNITTVINLKNQINFTSFMDVPINLNYTNSNNFSLVEQQSKYSGGGGGGSGDGCCIVIGPRECKITKFPPFVRCFHARSRQCGSFCTTNIVHQENTAICNSVNNLGNYQNCRTELTYIPQPEPKCSYTTSWPYVSCSIRAPSGMCNNCYGPQTMGGYNKCSQDCYQNMNLGSPYGYAPFFQPNFNPYSNICPYFPQLCSVPPQSFPIYYGIPNAEVGNTRATSTVTQPEATTETVMSMTNATPLLQ